MSPESVSGDYNVNIQDFDCEDFCDIYLAGRSSFHAYGNIDDTGNLTSLISFYESDDDPSWYLTYSFALHENDHLSDVLDTIIKHNESKGRLKFYSKIHCRIRGHQWSAVNNNRYSFFDEYVVPSHGGCFYHHHNMIMFHFNKMIPGDLIMRCNFLKQEHREVLPLGGNI